MAGRILVGTASWTDPGFVADWYPADLPSEERLRYYAERFNLVEVNSTFYAVPARRVVQRWCEQTPPEFVFDVKLHRLLSGHSTTLQQLPPGVRSAAEANNERVIPTASLQRTLIAEFLREIQPLRDAGKLGALLLQLSPAFGPWKHKLAELDSVVAPLDGYRVAIELRNRHWAVGEQLDQTLEFFRTRHTTFVMVDAPDTEHFMAMPGLNAVTNPTLAYFRLHGRNTKGYVTGKTVAERFDYKYSDEELKQIAERAERVAAQTVETHVIYNNNRSDYAPRNAVSFQQRLAQLHPEILPTVSVDRRSGTRPRTQPIQSELPLSSGSATS
jgi:uncharacterized protein YecE (DUF72 family)